MRFTDVHEDGQGSGMNIKNEKALECMHELIRLLNACPNYEDPGCAPGLIMLRYEHLDWGGSVMHGQINYMHAD